MKHTRNALALALALTSSLAACAKGGDAPGTDPQSAAARPAAEIRRAMQDALPGIRACYEQSLATRPGLRAHATVGFAIDGAGRVPAAPVVRGLDDAPELAGCVATRVQAIAFGASTAASTQVSYPFTFAPDAAAD